MASAPRRRCCNGPWTTGHGRCRAACTQAWAAGFLAAIRLRLEAWRPLLEAAETGPLLLPILVHIPAPGIDSHIAELPAQARRHLAGAYHHIPTAVAALNDLRHRSAASKGSNCPSPARLRHSMPASPGGTEGGPRLGPQRAPG